MAGSQRIGTLVWSGDIVSDFKTMRRQVIAGQHMAMAGIPWWTTDIGGFVGGDPNDPAFRELLVRWFQYGAFCPVFRLHGNRTPEGEPMSEELGGGMAPSGAANEVWSFGEEAYPILVQYMQLRERIRPYIKAQMERCHKEGTPVMRPAVLRLPRRRGSLEAWRRLLVRSGYSGLAGHGGRLHLESGLLAKRCGLARGRDGEGLCRRTNREL